MEVYRHFAQVYDGFMTTMPYTHWASYIQNVFENYNVPKNGTILDLACGTGTVTFLMSKKGYDIIGVDASADMLSVAQDKLGTVAKKTLLLNQDMRYLDLYGTIDGAYSSCDGLNYLLSEDDFISALKRVALFLNPGAPFIFDLKMDYKYRQLGNDVYNDANAAASYIWRNSYNPNTRINEYHVQFYMVDGRQFSETHHQRAYTIDEVCIFVKKAGLQVQSITDDYTLSPGNDKSERVTFTVS